MEHLVVDHPEKCVTRIRLNRPDRLNAFTCAMVDDLAAAVTTATRDPECRVIVLTGTGRGFCAGVDLGGSGVEERWLESRDPIEGRVEWTEHLTDALLTLRRSSRPIIAAINGVAVGGGLAIALLADIRIAGESARFADGFIRNGLSGCELGTSYLLPRLIGAGAAMEFMLTGREVGAAEAARLGLVSRVVPDSELEAGALDLASTIAAHSPFAATLTKQVAQASIEASSLETAMLLEMRTQMLAIHTADGREGRRALVERRQPRYTGRRTR